MSTIDVRMRLGDAIDPFYLANGFEAVIGYEWQERSNHPFSHSYDAYKSCEWVGGSLQCRRGILVILWMLLVDVACVGIVVCISKIDMLGGWVCLVETWTVVKTILNTR